MSLITSCPACGTMFRVVPDQLKISEGWVRCGHCGEVFDAAASLTEQPEPRPQVAEPESPARLPAQEQAVPDEAVAEQARPAVRPDPDPAPSFPSSSSGPPAAPAPSAVPPIPPVATEAPAAQPEPQRPAPYLPAVGNPAQRGVESASAPDSELLEESPHDLPFVFRRSDLVHDDDEHPAGPEEASRQESDRTPDSPARPPRDAEVADGQAPDSGLEEVSFVRQARRRAFWRRPLVRFALGLCVLLLAGLLTLQVAYQERDRLAVAVPELAPGLEHLCELAGCRLGPPRQIESVVIESSTFSKLRHDTYRLSFTLRSTASLGVAVPAMELTLTDGQDQPVLRRVLTPAELGARAPVLAPGTDLAVTVGILVSSPLNARVAGYRLLAFYP